MNEYHFPPDPEIELAFPGSPTLQEDSLSAEPLEGGHLYIKMNVIPSKCYSCRSTILGQI